ERAEPLGALEAGQVERRPEDEASQQPGQPAQTHPLTEVADLGDRGAAEAAQMLVDFVERLLFRSPYLGAENDVLPFLHALHDEAALAHRMLVKVRPRIRNEDASQ